MSNASQPACPHERRPGTTVCLHCRHAARIVAAEQRKKLLLRGSTLGGIVVAAIGVAGVLNATTLRDRFRSRAPAAERVAAVAPTDSVIQQGEARDSTAKDSVVVAPAATVAKPATPAAPTPATAPIAAVIPHGQSVLRDGAVAVRTDSTITLSFDAQGLRTRIPEKFERLLRSTLSEIYGPDIQAPLAKIPAGGIAAQGNLIRDLPTKGIHIPVNTVWRLDVFPETRPGQDGPLVVRYRVAVARD